MRTSLRCNKKKRDCVAPNHNITAIKESLALAFMPVILTITTFTGGRSQVELWNAELQDISRYDFKLRCVMVLSTLMSTYLHL